MLLPSAIARTHGLRSFGVLGGGLSGLSTAWYLSKYIPSVPVTLYEKSSRLGGWLQSKCVEYTDADGQRKEVLFEQGPRTLRAGTVPAIVTVDMIRQLGLNKEVCLIKNSHPSAKNRYIYYPDRLNKLPTTLTEFLRHSRDSLFNGVAWCALTEVFRSRRPKDAVDESVESFLTRRFGEAITQNFASAFCHGVYAGDIAQLSAKSIFPKQWFDEKEFGSVTRGFTTSDKMEPVDEYELKNELWDENVDLLAELEDVSMCYFKRGIQTLAEKLEEEIRRRPNITIKTGTEVTALNYDPKSDPERPFKLPTSDQHSHIISATPSSALSSLLPSHLNIPQLLATPSVTILVVSLFFNDPALLPVDGFGYLIPKSVPSSRNPHSALGVIFDSSYAPESDSPGTKLTVMLGGHYYNSNPPAVAPPNAVDMALETLRIQLGITEKPVASNVVLQKDAIPQYLVGHHRRMLETREQLLEKFDGRLAVVGSSYRGVGIHDCIRWARETTRSFVDRERKGKVTGLEGLRRAWKSRQPQPWERGEKKTYVVEEDE